MIQQSLHFPSQRMAGALALGVLMLGAGLYVSGERRSQPMPVTTMEVAVPIARTVTALGRLEPSGEVVTLSAPGDAGRMAELLVQEGDGVDPGQTLAILDSRAQREAAVAEAQQQVAIAQADLAKVRAGAQQGEIGAQEAEIARLRAERQNQIISQEATIRRLQATKLGEIASQEAVIARFEAELRNAEVETQRYDALFGEGAIAASQRDSVRLVADANRQQLEESRASLNRIRRARQAEIDEAEATLSRIQSGQEEQIRSAEANLDRITEIRPVDIQGAEAQFKAKQAALKRAEADLAQSYIKAPQAGTVLEILSRPGEAVANAGVLRLGQTQQMVAIAEVYESDVQKLQPGQSVTISSPSLPSELKGSVERIGLEIKRQDVVNTDPAANIDARIVEVQIQLDERSREQVAGFTNLQVTTQIKLNP